MGFKTIPPDDPPSQTPEQRQKYIQSVIDSVSDEDVDPENLQMACKKIFHAMSRGKLVLTSEERAAFTTLAKKFVPDAPKQINLKSEIRVENIIHAWLEENSQAEVEILERADVLALQEDSAVLALEAVKEKSDDGTITKSTGD